MNESNKRPDIARTAVLIIIVAIIAAFIVHGVQKLFFQSASVLVTGAVTTAAVLAVLQWRLRTH